MGPPKSAPSAHAVMRGKPNSTGEEPAAGALADVAQLGRADGLKRPLAAEGVAVAPRGFKSRHLHQFSVDAAQLSMQCGKVGCGRKS